MMATWARVTTERYVKRRMSFYQRWIVACAAGELIGIGVATGAAVVLNALVGEPESTSARLWALALFSVVGAVEGGALAGLQWRVLRSRLPRVSASKWVGVTVAIAVAGWILGMTPSLFGTDATSAPAEEPPLVAILLLAAAAGGGAGLCFGVAQWLVLRQHAQRAARWIWIHAPAWALAMSAIFLGAALPSAGSPAWLIAVTGVLGGVLGGLLLGAITGLVARSLQPYVSPKE
jgi:hypothetical protein